MRDFEGSRLVPFALSFFIAALTVYLLIVGKNLLIPLAMAVLIWYIINAIANGFKRIRIGRYRMPSGIAMTLALLATALAIILIVNLISGSVVGVSQQAPQYQANLQKLLQKGAVLLGLKEIPTISELIDQLDVTNLITGMVRGLTAVAQDTGIVLIYLLFLLLEQRTFDKKLTAIFLEPGRDEEMRRILMRIGADIRTYLWIKSLLALITGVIAYIVMAAVGLDFAAFWAFVIALLYFIPTVGTFLGLIFPAILALLQFESLVPFLVVTAVIGVAEMFIANIIEPRMMGKSLNISGFVMIVALVVWGSIWGVAGMFLCIPITVIMMIIFSNFRQTRGIAVLLSSDGEIKKP